MLETIPSENIIDRTRRVEAPEVIRPGADVDAENAWTQLEQAAKNCAPHFSPATDCAD